MAVRSPEKRDSECGSTPHLSGTAGRRVQRGIDRDNPTLTVIVPVFNEARTIDELLNRVVAVPIPKEVIVVDDGSTDGTATLLERWWDNPIVHVVRHSTNRGKGAAIRSALQHAVGEFVIIQDADLEVNPDEFPRLLKPLTDGCADFVIGTRFSSRHRGGGALQRIGIGSINLLVRLLYGQSLSDEPCCHKMLRTSDLKSMDLRCEGFEFCAEVVAKACRIGMRFQEVPISYRPRSAEEGKKIRVADGLIALRTLWKYRHWQPTGVPVTSKCSV